MKILFVDDDPAILLTMPAILRLEAVEVVACPSAATAVERLRHDDFDFVITDLRMETPTAGCEVIRAATAHPMHPRVVVLTAFPVRRSDLQQLGAHAVLQKGSDGGFLLGELRAMIQDVKGQIFSLHAT